MTHPLTENTGVAPGVSRRRSGEVRPPLKVAGGGAEFDSIHGGRTREKAAFVHREGVLRAVSAQVGGNSSPTVSGAPRGARKRGDASVSSVNGSTGSGGCSPAHSTAGLNPPSPYFRSA